MKKYTLLFSIIVIALSCSFSVNAEVATSTQAYIESLDDRLSISESQIDGGYTIFFKSSDPDETLQDVVHDFFWCSSQILAETSIGGDLQEHGNIYMYVVYQDSGQYGFTVYDYDFANYSFYTGISNRSMTYGVSNSFYAVFEHSYYTTFGGHDYENTIQALACEELEKLGVEIIYPSTYQNACFWAYSNFDKTCEANYTDSYIQINIPVDENSAECGSEQRRKFNTAMTDFTTINVFHPNTLPFEKLIFNYSCGSDFLLSFQIDLTLDQYVPQYSDDDSVFAEGFKS